MLSEHARHRAVVHEQQQFIRERNREKQEKFEADEKQRQQESDQLDSFVSKTCLVHRYEAAQKALQYAKNRQTWSAQILDRRRRQDADVLADRQYKPHAALRNESSDDEM